MNSTRMYWICVVLTGLFLTGAAIGQNPIPLRRAVEFALAQSSQMAVSHSDEVRAYQTYREAHDAYFPTVTVGSDVGYACGFPLSLEGSAPTLFNVSAQSWVWNLAQRESIKTANEDWGAIKSQTRDQRDQVIMDTALTRNAGCCD